MNYDDIIHLPHHVSKRHRPMSREDRAAQFAPFSALTGLGAVIREEARLTDEFIHLTDEKIAENNARLACLADRIDDCPTVSITYFCPDARKQGGEYLTVVGTVYRLDDIEGTVTLADGRVIPMAAILHLESDAFPCGGEYDHF